MERSRERGKTVKTKNQKTRGVGGGRIELKNKRGGERNLEWDKEKKTVKFNHLI